MILSETLHRVRSPKTFEYQPLAEDQHTIRLIRISPGRNHSQIECELKHSSLIDDGHVCLSYMWGSSKTSKSILVNGDSLSIGSNLWHFMSAARRMKISDWLWIDAVCIDQSTLREKSHQVKLMSEIYRLARHVIIWPRNPHFEFRLLRSSSLTTYSEKNFAVFAESDLESDTLLDQYSYEDMQPLDRCLQSPYWNRLWVLQEIILAKRHLILHKKSIFDMAKIDFSLVLNTDETISFVGLAAHRSLRSIPDVETQISSLLALCNRRQCHDPRDRWYGILGLLPRGRDFLVDYTLPVAALMLRVISHLIIEYRLGQDLYYYCDMLAKSMDLWLRIICGSCTLGHRQIYRQDLLSQSKPEASCLVVAVSEREALKDWFFQEGNSFQCALCYSELDWTHSDIYLREAFLLAENQMWCTVEHDSPTEAEDAEEQQSLTSITPMSKG